MHFTIIIIANIRINKTKCGAMACGCPSFIFPFVLHFAPFSAYIVLDCIFLKPQKATLYHENPIHILPYIYTPTAQHITIIITTHTNKQQLVAVLFFFTFCLILIDRNGSSPSSSASFMFSQLRWLPSICILFIFPLYAGFNYNCLVVLLLPSACFSDRSRFRMLVTVFFLYPQACCCCSMSIVVLNTLNTMRKLRVILRASNRFSLLPCI